MKLVAVLVLALAACTGDAATHLDPAKTLESTPWLDHAPHDETDVVHAWIFPRAEGVYFVGNAYKGAFELFTYFVEDDELRVRFLDENKTYKTRFRIERVDHGVFDYKLTLEGSPRGPKVYYGFAQGRAMSPAVQGILDRAR